MSLTIFGIIVVLFGTLLLARGGMVAMLVFTMVTTLFGGSAAIALPALGGSTIPPANLALVFLLLRMVLPGPRQMAVLGGAIRENAFLIIFCLYGAITAWWLPVLFRGAIHVTPLRPGAIRQLYEDAPLHFSSQNITTSFYLMGTLAAGIGACAGAVRAGSERYIVRAAIGISIAHALLGFLSVVVAGTAAEALIEVFRNGRYAQLDQSIAGFSRMNGLWPETSGFAGYGGTWLIFMTELWIRDIKARWSGIAAALLAVALFMSTSSTAYVTLFGYALVLGVRALLIPTSIPVRKLLTLAGLFFVGLIAVMAILVVHPTIFDNFLKALKVMTIDKGQSSSARQRLFMAMQGFNGFAATWGLGIGAGSFRSSSLVTAILGSMGVVGILSFIAHQFRSFAPLLKQTWLVGRDERSAVAAAAAWAALIRLIPAAISSPTADPGIVWAMFAGLALGLRRMPELGPRPAAMPVPRYQPQMAAEVRA